MDDFQNINRSFKHKPHIIPKSRKILLKLEGFKYVT